MTPEDLTCLFLDGDIVLIHTVIGRKLRRIYYNGRSVLSTILQKDESHFSSSWRFSTTNILGQVALSKAYQKEVIVVPKMWSYAAKSWVMGLAMNKQFLVSLHFHCLVVQALKSNPTPRKVDSVAPMLDGPVTISEGPRDIVAFTEREYKGTVTFCDLMDDCKLHRIPAQPDTVISLALSPDGKLVATMGAKNSRVRIFQVQEQQLLAEVGARLADGKWLQAMAFSPDGRFFALLNSSDLVEIHKLNVKVEAAECKPRVAVQSPSRPDPNWVKHNLETTPEVATDENHEGIFAYAKLPINPTTWIGKVNLLITDHYHVICLFPSMIVFDYIFDHIKGGEAKMANVVDCTAGEKISRQVTDPGSNP